MRIDDPEYVREQYASEAGLAARKAAYAEVTGPDAREIVFDAVAAAAPRSVLEVGCGKGELAERMQTDLGVEVVAVEQSPRMAELARARGIDARIGDVQELPFADESFDVAVAAWVLYHVPDLELALRELARVETRDAAGTVTFRDADQIRSYLRSSARLAEGAERVPELTEPLVARRHPVVFVAEKAA